MRENEERMEAMKGQVMGMMKTFMGKGAVGEVSSASGKELIVQEKAKVSDNGEGSDSEIEDKGIRHRHKKNECRWALGACFRCGETGHRIIECKKEKVVKCYQCGMTGHIVSGYRGNPTNVICGNCGKNGHFARMYEEQRAKYTECGVDGHLARVCRKKGLGQSGCSGN
ncbi:CCHC-type zinc finger nucleic acid binding protein-like [Palaemon carinicauda]|uniref:CCHC-type zinc finger nucleic acid binding protein-like n=1 Tax=Palaemon carinicauda TaxID=392227 RepID=UPI0035B6654C